MRDIVTPMHVAYGHSSILAPTDLEKRYGRLMRASAPPGGGGGFVPAPQNQGGGQQGGQGGQQGGDQGGSQGGGNNGGGNQGGTGTGEGNPNNTGQAFDATSFWSEPPPSGTGSPASRGSEGNGQGGGGQGGGGDDNASFGRQLGERVQGLTIGNAFMTQEMATQIGEGNFDGFNQALTTQNRQIVQEALQMSVGVMQRFGDQIMAEVDRRMGSQFQTRDNQQALSSEIPLAGDKALGPIVQSVFTQAMKHCSNDRAKAIAMTKDMLRNVHSGMAGEDTGLGIAPSTPTDRGGGFGSNTNWLEELAGR